MKDTTELVKTHAGESSGAGYALELSKDLEALTMDELCEIIEATARPFNNKTHITLLKKEPNN